MKDAFNAYFGTLYTNNLGSIIEPDEFCLETFGIAKKEDIIGRNIVSLLPDFSLDEFFTENRSHNIQLLRSKSLIAFSSYLVRNKKIYIRISILSASVLNRFISRLADGDVSEDAALVVEKILYGQERTKKTLSRIERGGVIGTSKEMQELFDLIERIADTNATILLRGETGVGKSMFAKIIHESGSRKNEPFMEINCAAIHKSLMESEMFGYEKGAFTGANTQGKPGKIELANNGTLFLDEVTEMPLEMQQKFLQAIQNKKITRIGGVEDINIDFRLITATNRDLEEMVKVGEFRRDLYYRINVIPLKIPPIRNRVSDIISLVLYFTRKNNEKYGKAKSFSKEAMQVFCHYNWPGNVRELENLIERAILTSEGDIIERKELPLFLQEIDAWAEHKSELLKDTMEAYEKGVILEAYSKYKTSIRVGEKLGISQTSAARKIRKYLSGTS